jgi:hypothetical protein
MSVAAPVDISSVDFELLFPFYLDDDDSLLEDLEKLPPTLQLKARRMKNAKKLQLKRTAAAYHVNEQMEVFVLFLKEAKEMKREEPKIESICEELRGLLRIWDGFRRHTHETYYYRWYFREASITRIRRVKGFLRNEIKLAFRLDHGASSFAEELKLLVVAITEMQVHAKDMPFEGPPLLSQRLAVAELNRRFEANGTHYLS